ncbi:GNAT family N-acetyltransferase [Lentilactobacillus farraginis]|uniref:Acetyltransferase n=1 Tax=Lentilactobacillus farraginis DSM 18382 = JCM 14108 TaxID=1423743 RepID=X0PKD7_9LACO|nr:GNAT family N-acetyltransferase [Lentilactobacillus farraginis]GAF37106.1 acetyltransferase [Lentilactobacillus farraginis DSM 18382 = JCM 14108]
MLINQSYRNLMALAVLDDQPVGIVTVDGLGANDGEVGIAVLSAYQGYTLGTNLLELAIDWAKTYSQLATLKLAVFKDNAAAVHLYQKLGFNQTGTESRNDRIILKMSLPVKK